MTQEENYDPPFQKERDRVFAERLADMAKTFHEKNIINADAFLTMNESLVEAYGDITRKHNRIEAQLKYSEKHLNVPSMRDNVKDLAVYSVYSVLFWMFLDDYDSKVYGNV